MAMKAGHVCLYMAFIFFIAKRARLVIQFYYKYKPTIEKKETEALFVRSKYQLGKNVLLRSV
ncbi:hypothetical protein SY85_00495 [Flavisolibacter tropicus]|uniref:Uncharacterized protein n=1 Tax=Flavisolibacter tropicus TaxID=1492898 RepID=A0A172TQX3_9BACT|nr:hypothetical protein SY85_00495 [Flavisolibacter tropicus]